MVPVLTDINYQVMFYLHAINMPTIFDCSDYCHFGLPFAEIALLQGFRRGLRIVSGNRPNYLFLNFSAKYDARGVNWKPFSNQLPANRPFTRKEAFRQPR
jgi:hypothetical protein